MAVVDTLGGGEYSGVEYHTILLRSDWTAKTTFSDDILSSLILTRAYEKAPSSTTTHPAHQSPVL